MSHDCLYYFDCGSDNHMAAHFEQELTIALDEDFRAWGIILDGSDNDVERYFCVW